MSHQRWMLWMFFFSGFACAPMPTQTRYFPHGRQVSSPRAIAAAAQDLECDPAGVEVLDKGTYIQARGCHRIVYFLKKDEHSWERTGPRFELTPEDEEPKLPRGAPWTPPQELTSESPTLSRDKAKQLTAWRTEAKANCILRVDGTLHQCFVMTDQPVLAEAAARVLPRWRFRPAMTDGRPIPVDFLVLIKFNWAKPNCQALSSPMLRMRCERAVESVGAESE